MNNHIYDYVSIPKALGCVHIVLDHLIYFLPFFSVPSGVHETPLFSELPPLSFQIVGCAGCLPSQSLKNDATQVRTLAFKYFSRQKRNAAPHIPVFNLSNDAFNVLSMKNSVMSAWTLISHTFEYICAKKVLLEYKV